MYYVDCFRYLSAERARTRWKSAGRAANPKLGEFDEDEEDFLSASHASTASDAFDFLFDSQNLNPEKVQFIFNLLRSLRKYKSTIYLRF